MWQLPAVRAFIILTGPYEQQANTWSCGHHATWRSGPLSPTAHESSSTAPLSSSHTKSEPSSEPHTTIRPSGLYAARTLYSPTWWCTREGRGGEKWEQQDGAPLLMCSSRRSEAHLVAAVPHRQVAEAGVERDQLVVTRLHQQPTRELRMDGQRVDRRA